MPGISARLREGFFWLTLDKPPLNTLTVEMLTQLATKLREAVKRSMHLIVLRGTGEQAFCAGLDMPDDSDVRRAALMNAANDVCKAFDEVYASGIPTAALVRGSAFGVGCELVSLCETVIAHEEAMFRLPAMNAKVFPCAISISLPTLIGQEATTRLMKSGETLNAQQALRLGLVHQVLSARSFLTNAEELLVMLSYLKQETKNR